MRRHTKFLMYPSSNSFPADLVVVSVVPFEQVRPVSDHPATGRVSVIVLVPVASAPVKVKVRVVGEGVVAEEVYEKAEGRGGRRAVEDEVWQLSCLMR